MDGLLLDTEGIYTKVTSMIAARYGRVFEAARCIRHWASFSQMDTRYGSTSRALLVQKLSAQAS
ncbi:hypothetical protein [Pseudomonas frederiksbergensis]|nr:hypothetical protein [Pseudomonas frederiksbergensis]